MADKCPDIRWHFIGALQKKQANAILKSKNLVGLQTIGKFGDIELVEKRISQKLDIMLQINTSGEEAKSGFIEINDVIKDSSKQFFAYFQKIL